MRLTQQLIEQHVTDTEADRLATEILRTLIINQSFITLEIPEDENL